MSLALANLSWWLRSSKQKEAKLQNSSTAELNLCELDTVKFPVIWGGCTTSKPGRVERKLHSREKQKIDREHDVVLVPSDGSCISDSDSDASDWSVGWSEPHAPGFLSDDDNDGGFGVLVPCYGHKKRDAAGKTNQVLENKLNSAECYPVDSKKYMEQWLSSLQNG